MTPMNAQESSFGKLRIHSANLMSIQTLILPLGDLCSKMAKCELVVERP